ncbi:MAG: phosphoadenylyl-sulfate reductase [Mycobacteriales bacterium]
MTEPALRDVAVRAGSRLDSAPAEEILEWALETFHPRLAIASSMSDAVLVDMAARLRPGLPVIFLDTGYHFAETLGMRDAVAASYPVAVHTIRPARTVAEQDQMHGPALFERDPDACCRMRKVRPLEEALRPYLAWATGIRREEATTRREVRVVEWDDRRGKVKVNPLAAWSQGDIDRYVALHRVLVNPLVGSGFASIGCAPCTRAVAPDEDARAGRWAGRGKVECGLHA